jgi:hypothetical protein
MTRGRTGLIFVIFGLLIWAARWLQFSVVAQIDQSWINAVALLSFYGAAVCIGAYIVRMIDA